MIVVLNETDPVIAPVLWGTQGFLATVVIEGEDVPRHPLGVIGLRPPPVTATTSGTSLPLRPSARQEIHSAKARANITPGATSGTALTETRRAAIATTVMPPLHPRGSKTQELVEVRGRRLPPISKQNSSPQPRPATKRTSYVRS
jgi:hypothetical protein